MPIAQLERGNTQGHSWILHGCLLFCSSFGEGNREHHFATEGCGEKEQSSGVH